MTYEEYQAAMDKMWQMWPKMAETEKEGIDLHPDDPYGGLLRPARVQLQSGTP